MADSLLGGGANVAVGRIRVLGCAGSIAAGARTTSFLLDDDLLVDAGTGLGDLPLDALARIDDVLLTHAHLDHILGVPLLADSVRRLRGGRGPIRIHALAPTLQALRDHILNGVVWPDFTRLPHAQAPLLSLHPIEVGQRLAFGQRTVEVLPAVHTVPACGYAWTVGDGSGWVIYSGDTAPQPQLWQALAADRALHGVILEAAFRDEEHALAHVSGHLHPGQFAEQIAHLPADCRIWLTHVKPGEENAILDQIRAHRPRQIVVPLTSGMHLDTPALQPTTFPAAA